MSESNIKTKSLIKTLIKENVGFEGAQAFVRIFDIKNMLSKIFWMLCLLASVLMCGYLLVQTLLTYLSFQVYTTTTTVHETLAIFPKITICNSVLTTTEYGLNLLKQANQEVSPDIDIFDPNNNVSYGNDLLWKIVNSFNNKIISISYD